MEMDIHKFYEITTKRLQEVAKYQREMCGKAKNLGKEVKGIENTNLTSALTYMDMFTQDYLMIPLYKAFPDMVPAVEESTGMKVKYQDNKSDYSLIIDPIDGTDAYCSGNKDYSSLVGLLHKNKMVVGVCSYPERGEIYAAIKGEGAWKIDNLGLLRTLPKLKDVSFNDKNVAVHYRLLREPLNSLGDNLHNKGYVTPSNKDDFKTNLTGILRIAEGLSCGFIGPHITLHDIGAPALIIEELGGVIRRFGYDGKDDAKNWIKMDNSFPGLDPKEENPRFRVIIAKDEMTIDKLVDDMINP
jgi:fructose-1,6-bisphosphatase/inositol monophosphatase family enzyme